MTKLTLKMGGKMTRIVIKKGGKMTKNFAAF